MSATINTVEATPTLAVVGEELRPLLTNDMGSPIEVVECRGPADAGPPPHHHPWDEIYVMLEGEIEVSVDGQASVVGPGATVHVPAGTAHSFRNLSDVRFLIITSKGNATRFFTQVSDEVGHDPDFAGLARIATANDIQILV